MKQIRVSDLAKEFGTTSEAILKLLWSQGFQARAASSRVDSFAVEWLRFEFTLEGPSFRQFDVRASRRRTFRRVGQTRLRVVPIG